MNINTYDKSALDSSRKVALNYSTSFSLGIRMLSSEYKWAIFSIYGFVRVADEIVDTFHNYPKERLLEDFKKETYKAIEDKISTNLVLHSFQRVCWQFDINEELIEPFFKSMEADLQNKSYDIHGYNEYIHGSAEVVGLMCLKVFCHGNKTKYDELKPYAKSLGSAFQKINFLRDIKSDYEDLGRMYFPGVDFDQFNETKKSLLVEDIRKDFKTALIGIKKLPLGCRFGVFTAYLYYYKLLEKIEKTEASKVLNTRIRINDAVKLKLFIKSFITFKMKAI